MIPNYKACCKKKKSNVPGVGVGLGGGERHEGKNPLLNPCWDTFLFNALEKKILDHFAFRCINRAAWKMPVLVDYTTPY